MQTFFATVALLATLTAISAVTKADRILPEWFTSTYVCSVEADYEIDGRTETICEVWTLRLPASAVVASQPI